MAKIRISQESMDKYLSEKLEELTILDFNHDPEVDSNLDEKIRKEKSKNWLESRLGQLEQQRNWSLHEMGKACEEGFLDVNMYGEYSRKAKDLYQKLENEAREFYEKAVRGELIKA